MYEVVWSAPLLAGPFGNVSDARICLFGLQTLGHTSTTYFGTKSIQKWPILYFGLFKALRKRGPLVAPGFGIHDFASGRYD